MGKPDLEITIKYNVDEDAFDSWGPITTDIVSTCLRAMLDNDDKKTSEEFENRDVYTIKIELDMDDDTFHVTSDTGNKSMTVGILTRCLKRLEKG